MLDRIFKSINNGSNAVSQCQDTQKVVKRLTNFGYDAIGDILNDLNDEINELKLEIDKNDINRINEEIGDVVFVLCNLANQYAIDLNNSIEHSTKEFQRRLLYMENSLAAKYGVSVLENSDFLKDTLEKLGDEEILRMWKEAKKNK